MDFRSCLFQAELLLVGWANHPKVVSLVQRAIDLGLSITWRDNVDDAELQNFSNGVIARSILLEEGFGCPLLKALAPPSMLDELPWSIG